MPIPAQDPARRCATASKVRGEGRDAAAQPHRSTAIGAGAFLVLAAACLLAACKGEAPGAAPGVARAVSEQALLQSNAFWSALANSDRRAVHGYLSRRGLIEVPLEKYVSLQEPLAYRHEPERELRAARMEDAQAVLIYSCRLSLPGPYCAIGRDYIPADLVEDRVLEERWEEENGEWVLAAWASLPAGALAAAEGG